MTDWVYKHISARIPGSHEHYLINAFGLLYEEVSASNLVKVDVHGKLVEDVPLEVNPAAFVIHGAIHAARPDVGCVLPTHTSTRAPNDDTPPSPTWVGADKAVLRQVVCPGQRDARRRGCARPQAARACSSDMTTTTWASARPCDRYIWPTPLSK